MTTSAREAHQLGYPSRQPAEVVAVIKDDDGAGAVAGVAVQEAVTRGIPVRFLQVVPPHLDDEGCSLAEEAMFRAGLRALRGHPRTHSVFEVVRTDVPTVIRSRSQHAVLVVVGAEGGRAGRFSLAQQCATAAACPVRHVAVTGDIRP